MQTHANTCKHLQTPADTCRHLQTPANTCKHLQTPANICKHLQTPANICRHLQTPANTCKHLQTPANTCKHMQTHANTCIHLHTPADTCRHLQTPADTCKLAQWLQPRACRPNDLGLGSAHLLFCLLPDFPIAYFPPQDKVPPFSTEQAKALLQEVLNQPVSSVFSEISAEPVAAASLGQVYRARLAGSGEEVAVKVQRPDVLESISLDQYILRKAVFAAVKLGLLADASILEVLDAFAVKYFEECDYLQEARSQMLFKEQMKRLPKILVPKVYPELCSRKVLVSEWVDGVKLADSTYGDTKELVTATLNCYLVQLLETGFLHADPHPGNMIRVHATGQLCLLDYGNMGQVTEDQRFALVEYIGHLINQDWDKVADDVVTLGFVPRDFVDQHRQMVVDILQAILGQLMAGGGAAGVDFTKFGADVDKLGSEVPLRLPGWYTIVLRAFGTLEGIGLAQDPNYSITYETFPYMAKRLLTDDHPRVRAALRYALYKDGDQLDVDRLEELAGYFTKFQSASEVLMGTGATSAVTAPGAGAAAPPSSTPAPSQSAVNGSTGGNGNGNDLGPSNANPSGLLPVSAAMSASSGAPLLDPATREVLQLTFSQEGNYVQEILVDELVRAVDALSREARAELWRSIATAAISVTTGGRSGSKSSTGVAGPLLTPLLSGLAVTAVAPWLPLAVGQGILPKGDKGEWPILLPGLLLSNGRVARGSLTEEDRKSLDVLQRLWKLVQPQLVQQTGVAAARPLAVSELREARRVAGELLPLMQALLPGLSLMGVRFLTKLVQRQLERLQEDIDRSFTPSAPQ
eukprot:jgi/Mesvir1/14468/Mv05177-RA.1